GATAELDVGLVGEGAVRVGRDADPGRGAAGRLVGPDVVGDLDLPRVLVGERAQGGHRGFGGGQLVHADDHAVSDVSGGNRRYREGTDAVSHTPFALTRKTWPSACRAPTSTVRTTGRTRRAPTRAAVSRTDERWSSCRYKRRRPSERIAIRVSISAQPPSSRVSPIRSGRCRRCLERYFDTLTLRCSFMRSDCRA